MNHLYNIHIKTRRTNNLLPSYQIVYEWEDCVAEILGCKIKHYVKSRYLNMIVRRIERILAFVLSGWHERQIGKTHKPQNEYFLSFEPGVSPKEIRCNKPNIIPIIIDFLMFENEIPKFERTFSRVPFVIVTNKEAMEFLQKNNCRLNIYHLPLSLPNKYTLDKRNWTDRSYDLVLAGRQNPIIADYLKKYCKANPQIKYLRPIFEKGTVNYYSNEGKYVATVWNREDYWKILKMGKIAFYSTPGIDGGEKNLKGFSQVTPRLLELLAAGCNVLTRYSNNLDSQYHELAQYFSNVQSYEDFEQEMERCMNTPPNYTLYQEYLDKHYTSTLVPLLDEIFSDFANKDVKLSKI